MNKPKAIFCWSGGKDSAYCLHKVLSENQFDIAFLLTTVNEEVDRVSMHGVRSSLLEAQADAIGLPVVKVMLQEKSNETYENAMNKVLMKAKSEGIEHVIFGDIFLKDLRNYRENNLKKVEMKAVFPLWNMNTDDIVEDFIDKGFKTVICCVNDEYLGFNWLGRAINHSFLRELPGNVDSCGENGEFHSFCFDGPIFKKPIEFSLGDTVYKPYFQSATEDSSLPENDKKNGFWFIDLILKN